MFGTKGLNIPTQWHAYIYHIPKISFCIIIAIFFFVLLSSVTCVLFILFSFFSLSVISLIQLENVYYIIMKMEHAAFDTLSA